MPPRRSVSEPTQNRLHLPLIKRAEADKVFDQKLLSRKKFHYINQVYNR
jgi:hypothetical protein